MLHGQRRRVYHGQDPASLASSVTKGRLELSSCAEAVSREFVRAVEEEDERTTLTIPPRHGLSTVLMEFGPLWALLRYPGLRVGVCTYSPDLASAYATCVYRHAQAFGPVVADRHLNELRTAQGGYVKFFEVFSALAGLGFDALIIDSPFKNLAAAMSPSEVLRVDDVWRNIWQARLRPGASVLVAGPGPMLGLFVGKGWRSVQMPALAGPGDVLGREIGEPLWPERFSREALLAMHRRGPQDFEQLYGPVPQLGAETQEAGS